MIRPPRTVNSLFYFQSYALNGASNFPVIVKLYTLDFQETVMFPKFKLSKNQKFRNFADQNKLVQKSI